MVKVIGSITKPTVSIMMPVYNGRNFIDASVKSLINQTFKDWECIVVNDGSTDKTAEYLSSITDSRFKIITFEKNQGRAKAREAALRTASGEYLAMLDAEDIYHPQKLERQVNIMKENPDIALVGCVICSFGVKCDILYKRLVEPGVHSFCGKLPTHAASMLRTVRAKEFHYNALLNYSEDADFLKHYLDGQKFILTPDILYYYSEIDSVTKRKLISYYKNGVRHGLSLGFSGIKLLLTNGLKYILGTLIYPFIDIKKILLKRGVPLSEEELSEYKKIVFPLIHKAQ